MPTPLVLGALIDVFATIVMVLFVLISLLMCLVILAQEGKGGGLAGAFGGAGAETFGVKAGTVNKFTSYLATAFLVLALLHAGLSSASHATIAGEGDSDTEAERFVDPDPTVTDPETPGDAANPGDGDAAGPGDAKDEAPLPADDGSPDDGSAEDDAAEGDAAEGADGDAEESPSDGN